MKEELGNLLIAYEHVASQDTQELFIQLQRELKKYEDLENYINKAKEVNNTSSAEEIISRKGSDNESRTTTGKGCNTEIMKVLEYLLKESRERIKILQQNLKVDDIEAVVNMDKVYKNDETKIMDEEHEKDLEDNIPHVVILHDQLCNSINDSIMTREKVSTKKVYCESLKEVILNLDTIGSADVFVIQALTHSLLNLTCDEFSTLLKEAVTIALSKANKVVISLIISRDDDHIIHTKAELINATIKYNYRNRSNVIICSNENLKSRKFRIDDGLHLTPHGVSLLAVNLKQKIADALGIVLVKKPARSYERSVIGLSNGGCRQRSRGCNVW